MFHVDAEKLTILKTVQCRLPPIAGFLAVDLTIEGLAKRSSGSDERRIAIVLQEREQVAVLATEKVLPEKITGAEQAGK